MNMMYELKWAANELAIANSIDVYPTTIRLTTLHDALVEAVDELESLRALRARVKDDGLALEAGPLACTLGYEHSPKGCRECRQCVEAIDYYRQALLPDMPEAEEAI